MIDPNENQNHLVGLHQLARELCLPAAWLKAESDKGQLPCLRVGRRRLFNLAAVRRVLTHRAARFEGSTAE